MATTSVARLSLDTNHNALQLSLRRQWSHGLTYKINYTFGKYLDEVGTSFGLSPIAQDVNNNHGEYGPSDYDTRHVLEFNYTYDLPMPHSRPGWLGRVGCHWQSENVTPKTKSPNRTSRTLKRFFHTAIVKCLIQTEKLNRLIRTKGSCCLLRLES
jgi:hypothetical protein